MSEFRVPRLDLYIRFGYTSPPDRQNAVPDRSPGRRHPPADLTERGSPRDLSHCPSSYSPLQARPHRQVSEAQKCRASPTYDATSEFCRIGGSVRAIRASNLPHSVLRTSSPDPEP